MVRQVCLVHDCEDVVCALDGKGCESASAEDEDPVLGVGDNGYLVEGDLNHCETLKEDGCV